MVTLTPGPTISASAFMGSSLPVQFSFPEESPIMRVIRVYWYSSAYNVDASLLVVVRFSLRLEREEESGRRLTAAAGYGF
jgi:hypothetical protein